MSPVPTPRQPRVSHDGLVRTLLPAVDLTPASTDALERLRPSRRGKSQRGTNWWVRSPLREWTTPLDAARVAAHLGVALPQVPALSRRGCTTSVRGFGGDELFDHAVPSAADTPPGRDPWSDRHSVLVLHVPPGADAGEVKLQEDRPAGVGWMRIHYGRYLSVPGDPGEDDPEMQAWEESRRRDLMRLHSPDGPTISVLRRGEEQTSTSWRCLVADSLFEVVLVLPFAPPEAVLALAEAAAAACPPA